MTSFTMRRLSAESSILITLSAGYEPNLARLIDQIMIYLNQTRQETSLVFDVQALDLAGRRALVRSLSILTQQDLAVLDHALVKQVLFVGPASQDQGFMAIDQCTYPNLDDALRVAANCVSAA